MNTFTYNISYYNHITPAFKAANSTDEKINESKKNNQLKWKSLTGSLIGTTAATTLAVASTEIEDKIFNKILKTDFARPKNILLIALGSIFGGLIGGLIEDKGENAMEKVKESNFQILSNIVFPLIFLSAFKKGSEKLTETASKTVKNVGNFVSVFGGVILGAFVGSKVATAVNDNIIEPDVKYDRKLGVKDFLIHVDDLPMALAFSGIPYIDKLIPFILISRGYDVGKQN